MPLIIDRNFLAARKDFRGSFLRNLIKIFNLEVPKLIVKLKKSHQMSDYEDVKNLGHKLKGMSLNLGAFQLSEIGRKIEESEPDRVHLIISRLDGVFERTRLELIQLLDDL